MKTYRLARAIVIPAVGIWVVSLLLLGVATAAQGQAATEAGVQVLTRGPVHEAFAEASMTGATAGVVITKASPDAITELPPDQRPEGDNVAWIPGYWSWDDDRTDFIWVSGVWRDLPPGRQWVPGYWTPVEGGSQWISGFWGDVAETEVTYLPAPPEPLEAGPSSPAPAPDHTWTSGCWVWQDTRYDWQPGYWMAPRPDWIWSSAHYTWTPRGYVFVPGYWDYALSRRGVMFAPVYYDQPLYMHPGYSYSPSIVLDLGVMAACLFVLPSSHHYYYGDYYDHRYEDRGFLPWYSTRLTRYGNDPIYQHYRSQQLLQDPHWDTHMDEQFRYRRDHIEARPPQTLALQANFVSSRKAGAPENVVIGQSFAEAAQNKTRPQRFSAVNMDERKQIQTRGEDVRKFQSERAKMETAPAAAGKSKGSRETAQPVRMQLRASPVAGKRLDKMEKGNAPPAMPSSPKAVAAEGRGRQEKPQKGEAKTQTLRSQEKPAKAQTRTSREKPAKAQTRTSQERPAKVEATPSRTKEKPQRVQANPRTTTPESTPQKLTPKPAPTKRERIPARTESRSPASQDVGTSRPQKVQARPEAKPPRAPQVQSRPQNVEPRRESPKAEASRPEVRQRNVEPKAQAPRTETKQQQGKQPQAPSKKDNKNRKFEER